MEYFLYIIQFGVWRAKKMYSKGYEDNIRSVFLIDEKGKIAAGRYKISSKNTVSRLMEAL